MNDLFLRACRREPVERPPVWMMRQAGRYLPEYRAVRERADFLTMVRHARARRRGDAPAGRPPRRGRGDHLQRHPGRSAGDGHGALGGRGRRARASTSRSASPADFARLRDVVAGEDLGYVLDAIRLARRELAGRVPLIGFAGAPWTLMSYMIEGRRIQDVRPGQALAGRGAGTAPMRCSARLARAVGAFLVAQVRAGAQAVQLFDSWAGALGPRDFREFALPYLARGGADRARRPACR